ncbi:hypothetical protein V5O48_005304 [Marasmius crinis-equi]|uniref:Uncharacterized protein n=1 Tax=Marasmius crinis-equi TaxID=585013 RepID=A0ABR3FMM8_9AGAR
MGVQPDSSSMAVSSMSALGSAQGSVAFNRSGVRNQSNKGNSVHIASSLTSDSIHEGQYLNTGTTSGTTHGMLQFEQVGGNLPFVGASRVGGKSEHRLSEDGVLILDCPGKQPLRYDRFASRDSVRGPAQSDENQSYLGGLSAEVRQSSSSSSGSVPRGRVRKALQADSTTRDGMRTSADGVLILDDRGLLGSETEARSAPGQSVSSTLGEMKFLTSLLLHPVA